MINEMLLDRFIKYCRKSSKYICYTKVDKDVYISGISAEKFLKNYKSFNRSNKNLNFEYDTDTVNSDGAIRIIRLDHKFK